MKFVLNFALAFLLLISTAWAQSQVLLVSDVDDTIKLANVQDFSSAAGYALDSTSRFMGMSALYNTLVQDNPGMQVVYLSRAPKWLMSGVHQRLLKNGNFPEGTYIGRSKYSSDVHKIQSLRDLINSERPRKVILVGDNGEADADVYNQIVSEYQSQGIEFQQFIRIVYSKSLFIDWGAKLYEGQVGFVTPVEVALELEKKQLLFAASVQTLVDMLAPRLSNAGKNYVDGEYAFPPYVNCGNMKWQWDDSLSRFMSLPMLKKRIFDRCGL